MGVYSYLFIKNVSVYILPTTLMIRCYQMKMAFHLPAVHFRYRLIIPLSPVSKIDLMSQIKRGDDIDRQGKKLKFYSFNLQFIV